MADNDLGDFIQGHSLYLEDIDLTQLELDLILWLVKPSFTGVATATKDVEENWGRRIWARFWTGVDFHMVSDHL